MSERDSPPAAGRLFVAELSSFTRKGGQMKELHCYQ